MKKYVMALDQGTTSSRCILFDKKGNICSVAQKEFEQIYPKPGWVEHDPMEIWASQLSVATEAISKIGASADEIASIGITNQRETTVVWNRETGMPIYNAIVWQCRRTAERIDQLKEDGLTDYVKETTGLIVAGAAIQWLRDEMRMIRKAADTERYATAVEDTAGVYLVPAFTGIGAPYWDPYARGTVVGITRGCKKEHFIRAALESMAYQTNDILKVMEEESGVQIRTLKVDGGASNNNFLMQFQSDILGVDVLRPQCVETTALGAAYLAGIAVGYWEDVEDVRANWALSRTFHADMSDEKRQHLLKGWKKAVGRAFEWVED